MEVFGNECSADHRMHCSKTLAHIGGGGGGGGRLSKIKIVIKRTRIEDDENTCNLEAG